MGLKWLLTSVFTQVSGRSCDVDMMRHESQNGKDFAAEEVKIGGKAEDYPCGFQVPLHYPNYTKAEYEKMEEWKVDLLLKQYGLSFKGSLDEKRAFVIGAFLWPDQI